MAWAPDYTDLDVAREYLRIDDTEDDALISVWITAASRAIDKYTKRQFGQVESPQEAVYDTRWDRLAVDYTADIDDLFDVSGLSISDSGGNPVTSYTLYPRNAAWKGRPYTQLSCPAYATVTVTASWGWPEIPAAVIEAALLQLARWQARRDAPFGVAGSPDAGSEIRLLAKLDADVETSLASVRREWWVR